MVSASKLRRAQERAIAARPYAERMHRMLAALAEKANPETAPALLTGHKAAKNHLLILATADRGLCGGFNSSIVRATKKAVAEYARQGKKVQLLTVGRKGREQLSAATEKYTFRDHIDTRQHRAVQYDTAEEITAKLLEFFEKGEIDTCSIVYNKFLSAISQKVTFGQLIPLPVSVPASAQHPVPGAVYDYEPSEEAILAELLPQNIAVQIFGALLENAASEQGARMTAMDNATRNAGEMIGRLTLQYNRTRQAAITKELIEIISGAEAI